MNTNSAEFTYDAFKNNLDTITDFFAKQIFVINNIFDFKQYVLFHSDDPDKYPKSLRLEKKRYKSTSKIEQKRLEALQLAHSVSLNCPSNNQICPENPAIILTLEAVTAFILSRINAMDKKHWKYFFLNETDRDIFVKAVAEYFINGTFTMPGMMLQKLCKTQLCIVLNSIHRYYKGVPLNEYSGFIKLMKILPVFAGNLTIKYTSL